MVLRSIPIRQSSPALPPPEAFGLPPKFSRWRNMQEQAILSGIDSDCRFVFQAAPTGFGKSPVYVGHALITGARTCILTSTKGLQSQLVSDFGDSGMVDVRGMNSYICNAAESEFGTGPSPTSSYYSGGRARQLHCHEGPCRSGLRCSLKDAGCDYYDAVREAKRANLVVTNYAFWMTINRYRKSDDEEEGGLGKFDLLILDEGHHAPDELSGFLSVELEAMEIESVMQTHLPDAGYSMDDWRQWASIWGSKLRNQLDRLVTVVRGSREAGEKPKFDVLRQIRDLRGVIRKLQAVAGIKGEWVVEVSSNGRSAKFDPVWPAEYAEECLFLNVPRVVIFSATIRPKTASILGIQPKDYEFLEYPSEFPAKSRPVYHIPTCRMDHRATPEHVQTWLSRIDGIIRKRTDRKGIIHTTSYARRNQIMQNSEYAHLMISHDPSSARSTIDRFKKMHEPGILVSPSVSTGYDFPGDECRYQIIAKLPFPDSRSTVMKARQQADKEYGAYIMAQDLVQMVGRGTRSMDDWCETFIIDDHWEWVQWKLKSMFPKWFIEACIRRLVTPDPPSLKETV